jgi:hypothetical protein
MSAVTTGFQQKGRRMKMRATILSPQDYVEIQQLYVRVANAIDSKESNGRVAGDLFTADGVFRSGSWEIVGAEKIAEAINNGPGGAKLRHVTTNIVIDPTPEGARVHAYLTIFAMGSSDSGQAPSVSSFGVYDDNVVKTPNGWRIKHRELNMIPAAAPEAATAGTRQ